MSGTADITLPEMTVTAKRDPPPAPAPAPSGDLFGRYWDLVVGKADGDTISLQDFHLRFSVQMAMAQTPASMVVTVINVDPGLASQILEYSDVVLNGGYLHVQHGELFHGQITFFEYGKLSPTETFLRIHAATADDAFTGALMNQNLPAGYTPQLVVQSLLQELDKLGIKAGHISPLSTNQAPRGRTLFGQPRDHLRDLAYSEDAKVWIDKDNKLNIVKKDDPTFQMPTIEINMNNGLVGIPSQQIGAGLRVQCLINPALLPGVMIKLNQQDVNQVLAAKGVTDSSSSMGDISALGKTAGWGNGIFQVYSVEHQGDTRGNEWYTTLVTLAADPTTQPAKVS